MSRRAAKVDANHAQIAADLRTIGASVVSTAGVADGFPDLVVGFRGRNWLMEIKDGSKPPRARKLTPDQERFAAAWRGHYVVVYSPSDAIRAVTES